MPHMDLDEEEVEIILRRRKELQEHRWKQFVQSVCDHDWKWVCSMHNDDAYDCTKCGATKFE